MLFCSINTQSMGNGLDQSLWLTSVTGDAEGKFLAI